MLFKANLRLDLCAIILMCFWLPNSDGQRVEKCGLMDFDPNLVNLQPLQKEAFYLYHGLPVPPCTGTTLEYVNYCFNFSSSNSKTTDTVGIVYILDPSSFFSNQYYTVRKRRTIQATVSDCEGSLFQNGDYSLCCISTLLEYTRFTIDDERVNRVFAVYIPDQPYSIGLGYKDERDNDLYGYQPQNIPSSEGSRFSRSMEFTNKLPSPLVSFTEKATASFQPALCTCLTQSSNIVSTSTPAVTQAMGSTVAVNHQCEKVEDNTQDEIMAIRPHTEVHANKESSKNHGTKEVTDEGTAAPTNNSLYCLNGTVPGQFFWTIIMDESRISVVLALLVVILFAVCIILVLIIARMKCVRKKKGSSLMRSRTEDVRLEPRAPFPPVIINGNKTLDNEQDEITHYASRPGMPSINEALYMVNNSIVNDTNSFIVEEEVVYDEINCSGYVNTDIQHPVRASGPELENVLKYHPNKEQEYMNSQDDHFSETTM